MNIYNSINIFVLVVSICIYNKYIFVNRTSMIMINYSGKESLNSKMNLKNNVFLFIVFIGLLLIAGFRGGFTTDYSNYVNLYRIIEKKTMYEVLSTNNSVEVLYALMNKIIALVFNNYIYIFIFSAFITLYFNFKEIKKHSEYVWLSVLLFVSIGSYFVSFNLMRQVLAAALFFGASKYLYERNIAKYVISILFISLIHKSAIVLIPFYFFLNIKWNKGKVMIFAPLYTLLLVSTYLFTHPILEIVRRLFYSNYTDDFYGMSVGLEVKTIAKALIIVCFIVWNYHMIDFNKIKERIWFNASLFYFAFSLLGLKVEMIQRYTHYFSPYVLLIIPLIISKKKNKSIKIFNILLISAFLLAYVAAVRTGDYYFLNRQTGLNGT